MVGIQIPMEVHKVNPSIEAFKFPGADSACSGSSLVGSHGKQPRRSKRPQPAASSSRRTSSKHKNHPGCYGYNQAHMAQGQPTSFFHPWHCSLLCLSLPTCLPHGPICTGSPHKIPTFLPSGWHPPSSRSLAIHRGTRHAVYRPGHGFAPP